VFVSQVFFDSGLVFERFGELADACPDDGTFVVVDGYHGFCALPTDLAALEGRLFYLGGGYKHAMAGEGACFMHCPPDYGLRPVNMGWFAGFDALEERDNAVGYAEDDSRFMGATFDPTAWFRLGAVFDLFDRERISVADGHAHVQGLQQAFLDGFAGVRALDLEQTGPGDRVPRARSLPHVPHRRGQRGRRPPASAPRARRGHGPPWGPAALRIRPLPGQGGRRGAAGAPAHARLTRRFRARR